MVESLIKMSKEGDFLGKCSDNIKRNNYALNTTADYDEGGSMNEDFDDTSSNDSFSDSGMRKSKKGLNLTRSNSRKSVR